MRKLLLTLPLVALLCGVTDARPPSLTELPTLRVLQERADKAIEDRRRAEEEARRDPKMDRIVAYERALTRLDEWKEVADILKDDREDAKYRNAAARALCTRFKDLDRSNPQISSVMKRIGQDLLGKLNDKDKQVRIRIFSVFSTLWPGKAQVYGYKPDGQRRDRNRGIRAWREFLR